VAAASSVVLLAAVAAACRKAPPQENAAPAAPPPSASVASVPADHLGPDELVEGTQQAFGLTLPKGLVVTGTLTDRVFAKGWFRVHPLVEYFRARLQDGALREGAESATFEHVKVPGKPGLELAIHIEPATTGGTNVIVRDTTPPPVPDLPNEEERWKATGLSKQGKVLDPSHLD
jgi:hypothetical protein